MEWRENSAKHSGPPCWEIDCRICVESQFLFRSRFLPAVVSTVMVRIQDASYIRTRHFFVRLIFEPILYSGASYKSKCIFHFAKRNYFLWCHNVDILPFESHFFEPDWDASYIRVRLIVTRVFCNFPNLSLRLIFEPILYSNHYGN